MGRQPRAGADANRRATGRGGAAHDAPDSSTLTEAPDFLRLGLMLILEHHRGVECQDEVRRGAPTHDRPFDPPVPTTIFPHLDADAHRSLAMLTMAAADGILVAHEIDDLDMAEAFDLLAAAILGAADHLAIRA